MIISGGVEQFFSSSHFPHSVIEPKVQLLLSA